MLKKYSAEIGSAAAILGVLLTSIGFAVTIIQVVETKRTLQAANVYEIQRDARELVDGIIEEGHLQRFLLGQTLSDIEARQVEEGLWRMNNFYLSVFRQSEAGGIRPEFSASFASDFCSFTSGKEVNGLWEKMLLEKKIGDAHVRMREEWCK